MTSSPQGVPPVGPIIRDLMDEDEPPAAGPTIGASDAEADRRASGAPASGVPGLGGHPTRDSDGVPVGSADADEDRRASGAE
jgi:hypothetical protein